MPCMAIMLASSVLLICCEMNSIAYLNGTDNANETFSSLYTLLTNISI